MWLRRVDAMLIRRYIRHRPYIVSWWRRGDRGAVTAEFATILPAVMVIALVLMGLGRAVAVSMDCQDAASAVARELVVGGDGVNPADVARDVAGDKASVSVDRTDGLVHVTVSCPVVPGPGNILPARVQGKATGVGQ